MEFGNMIEVNDEHPSKHNGGSEIKELEKNEKKDKKV
jgi:hypothetical protein